MSDDYKIIGKIMATYPEISDEDQQILNDWFQKEEGNKELFESVVDGDIRFKDLKRFGQLQNETATARSRFQDFLNEPSNKAKIYWWGRWQIYVAAASIILMILVSLKWLDKKNPTSTKTPVASSSIDVAPGQFKAQLNLSDGRVINVDSFFNGRLVQQNGITVYNKNGQLVYEGNEKEEKETYNILSTAKGQMYGTILNDGTKVWLNSQSSIRYPITFRGETRTVEITGEAYFEVAHNTQKQFHVMINGMDIQVVGTQFNVNGYDDETKIKTTLIEGKVKIFNSGSLAMLLPGEQAQLNKVTKVLDKLDTVDVDEAVAWRNGYFKFNNTDLHSVLRQLSRWYDMEVVFNGSIPEREFVGKIPRNSSLLQVLAILETMQVHFDVKGKKIIVSA